MNGADVLIDTLVKGGVTACFANPGTSEMQFVAALDRVPAMRPVLCLFEGVATGAADGYGRMAGAPACTLLHLGPGYGNGLANLHNARRALTPIVNIVGDHATYHRRFDAPLNSDIAGIVGPNSLWVRSADSAQSISALAAEAIEASRGPPGGPVTLILPADAAWSAVEPAVIAAAPRHSSAPEDGRISAVARAIRAAANPMLLLGTPACGADGLRQAGRLDAAGVRICTDTFISRQARGAGHFTPARLPYYAESALEELAGVDLLVLVGTTPPVAFFAYPDRPSELVPTGCATALLCDRSEDSAAALGLLADALGAPAVGSVSTLSRADGAPAGRLSARTCGVSIGRHLPEGAVICDDSVTAGPGLTPACLTAAPHEHLALTGGAIGIAMPLAIGAAVACPERKVLALSGDGSAMYTLQSLWTMARERLDITAVIFVNNSYRVLNIEMDRTGAGVAGPSASMLLDLGDPDLDWVKLSEGLGVEAVRCDTAEGFDAAFADAMRSRGPRLIAANLG